MADPRVWVLWLIALLACCSQAAAQQTVDELDGKALFFEGLDMREAGDCEGAIGRFQLAFTRDPTLHQARLHVAECFQELGLLEDAVREARVYLDAGFEMAEVERACALIVACGGEPCEPVADDPDMDPADPVDGGGDVGLGDPIAPVVTTVDPVPPAQPASWTLALLEVGASANHHANSASLTTVGPLVAAQLMPWRHLQVTLRVRVGFSSWRGDGVQVPDVGVGLAGSIPIGRARLAPGVIVPVVFSGFGGSTRADAGILGQVAVRVPVGDSRLVVGGQVDGGYLVSPVVGGSVRIGVQLGPRGRTE